MQRFDGRVPDQLRPFHITPGYQLHAEGSVLVEAGNTRVVCAVSVEDRVPSFLRGTGLGWITAEYGMLPRSTTTRTARPLSRGREQGRSLEIQRLIGRSLRAVVDRSALGEHTFIVDCDVLQADGGTRTAAVTGGYVALVQALRNLSDRKVLTTQSLVGAVAAVSVGIVDGVPLLDLCYEEDAQAEVDCNVVMTDKGELIEIQGAAERHAFSRSTLDDMLTIAERGINELLQFQQEIIRGL